MKSEDNKFGMSTGNSRKSRNSRKIKQSMLLRNDEVRFLQRTRNHRWVMFLGMGVTEETGDTFIVLEYMDGGSLDRMLWGAVGGLCWEEKLQILQDCAEALTYLHCVHSSVHRDLKSPNILLQKNKSKGANSIIKYRAKLADFGLSKIVVSGKSRRIKAGMDQLSKLSAQEQVELKKAGRSAGWVARMTGYVGTPQWMAPEYLSSVTNVGPSADIFSFGVVMWECLSEQQPWRGFDSASIFEQVKQGKRCDDGTNQGTNGPDGFVKLIHECWKQRSDARPIITYVGNRLREIMEQYVCEKRESRKGSLAGNVVISDDSEDTTTTVSIEMSEVVSKESS